MISKYGEKLSPHFRIGEFVCPCCGDDRISARLVAALEELREIADAPIHVTSGVRCEKYNMNVGGSPISMHLIGDAADIVIEKLHPYEMELLAEKVAKIRMGGIGVYPNNGFIHVDVRLTGPARWTGSMTS